MLNLHGYHALLDPIDRDNSLVGSLSRAIHWATLTVLRFLREITGGFEAATETLEGDEARKPTCSSIQLRELEGTAPRFMESSGCTY